MSESGKVAGTLRVPWRFSKVCEVLTSDADGTRSVPAAKATREGGCKIKKNKE